MDLKGKHAIVTGTSKGIGKYIVEHLVAKGAKVVAWSRSETSVDHPNVKWVQADVGNEEDVKNGLTQSLEFLDGKVDILINNAGIGIFKKLVRLSTEEWDQMFNTNVRSIYLMCRDIVPLMKEAQSGHIINIASIAALEGLPEATAYCGSKFAVKGISESLYKEVKKYGVKVSCVYPGSVHTDFFDNYDFVKSNDSMLNPKEVAAAIVNLLEFSDNFSPLNFEIRPLNVTYTE